MLLNSKNPKWWKSRSRTPNKERF